MPATQEESLKTGRKRSLTTEGSNSIESTDNKVSVSSSSSSKTTRNTMTPIPIPASKEHESTLSLKEKNKASTNNDNVDNSITITDTNVQPESGNEDDLNALKIGSFHYVSWRRGRHKAEIIEKRKTADGSWDYYVHYSGYDRRLDEWIEGSNVIEPVPDNAASHDHGSVEQVATMIADRKITRNLKRKFDELGGLKSQGLDSIDPKFSELEKEREEITKVKNIDSIEFGQYEIQTWYFSPYPDEYKDIKKLFVCEFCLKYMKYPETMIKHTATCKQRHPPGQLIYRKDKVKVYEVDGKAEKLYCQNLCLLSKLFLDHKTVYYDIEPFWFYVLTEVEIVNGKEVDHVVGYFSKEKQSYEDYNLACILVLPPYQRRGYGRLLIEFSYELSKLEAKVGSPERPLSDLGLVGYRSFWQSVLLRLLRSQKGQALTIKDLALMTSIRQEDIIATLSSMNMLRYWKGEHIICVTSKMLEDFLKEHPVKLNRLVDPSCITWTPPIEDASVQSKKK